MSSSARNTFLENVRALRAACELAEVQASDTLGDFFRRGITVSAFNLLETFIDDRWKELALHINAGQTQFVDLPEKIQRRAIRQTLSVANAKIQRGNSDFDLPTLRDFSKNIGGSLVAVDRHLKISAFTWVWSGSNMTADDLSAGLKHIHVDRPWDDILDFTTRLGFKGTEANGDRIDLKGDLHALAAERHRCAHVASHGVSSLWLRAVPSRILRFAIGFDCLASIGSDRVRRGDSDFLNDEKWLNSSKIRIRKVRQRGLNDFAEFREGQSRAYRKSADGLTLFREACKRAGELEIVAYISENNEILDWAVPGPG